MSAHLLLPFQDSPERDGGIWGGDLLALNEQKQEIEVPIQIELQIHPYDRQDLRPGRVRGPVSSYGLPERQISWRSLLLPAFRNKETSLFQPAEVHLQNSRMVSHCLSGTREGFSVSASSPMLEFR